MKKIPRYLFGLLAALVTVIAACGSDSDAFTLYRSSLLDGNMRIHVATFDTGDGANYNSENCNIGAQLFAAQPGVKVRYWCEKGRYKK